MFEVLNAIKKEVAGLGAELVGLKELFRNVHQPLAQQSTPVSERSAIARNSESRVLPHHTKVEQAPTNAETAQPPLTVESGHCAGVHRLLRWPTIKTLLSYDLQEDFFMQLEQQKGIIRVYGRGQGVDRYEGGSTDPSNPSTLTNFEIWGCGIGTPNMVNGTYSNGTTDDHLGGLNPDGTLRMDPHTVDKLFSSYIQNLHVLVPFLSLGRLKRMFEQVKAQMNPTRGPSSKRCQLPNGGKKRKRSNGGSSALPFLERRISTVIVLMVMALGKICEAKDPLCGPVTENWTGTSPPDRNIDVIPGLAYYVQGAEMLGTLHGGNDLSHVQAMLLASMYCGQFASLLEAWSWLSQAGHACLFLMNE